jgi:hypothetical protein
MQTLLWGAGMSSEEDTRRLLKYRQDLESRLRELEQEQVDLRTAITVLDSQIVRQGFRKPSIPVRKPVIEAQSAPKEDQSSIKSKNGVTLGSLSTKDDQIEFNPTPGLAFTISTPPFQSFMIDRVLENMKKTDEEKAALGEKPASQVLAYDVNVEGGRIISVKIMNYGGDRRLREIRSSLRWVFDKMYDKLSEG